MCARPAVADGDRGGGHRPLGPRRRPGPPAGRRHPGRWPGRRQRSVVEDALRVSGRAMAPVAGRWSPGSCPGDPAGRPGLVRGGPRPGRGDGVGQLRRHPQAGRGHPRWVEVGPERWLSIAPAMPPTPRDRPLAELFAGAEALGVADWCVGAAAGYAAVRVQFGRPIGEFQAVKHRCADMLVTLEAARAAVWDAARCFDAPAEEGATVARRPRPRSRPRRASRRRGCIQVLGGIGYTWEHDAHLFLKRATAIRHLLPAPRWPGAAWRRRWPRATPVADGRAAARGRAAAGRGAGFVEDLRTRPSEWRRRWPTPATWRPIGPGPGAAPPPRSSSW